MRQWKNNTVGMGFVVLSLMVISLRVIVASEGRPNFLIILTDDQDVVLNGMVKKQYHAQCVNVLSFLEYYFVDANGKDSTIVG